MDFCVVDSMIRSMWLFCVQRAVFQFSLSDQVFSIRSGVLSITQISGGRGQKREHEQEHDTLLALWDWEGQCFWCNSNSIPSPSPLLPLPSHCSATCSCFTPRLVHNGSRALPISSVCVGLCSIVPLLFGIFLCRAHRSVVM